MSAFLDACGAAGPLPWRVARGGAGEADLLTFDRPMLVVGSDPAADLLLPHPDVCPRHAYLQWVGGRLFCADLGSRLGTHVDGQSLRSGWIDPGATIRIGPYRLRLADAGVAVVEGRGDEPAAPGLALELTHRWVRSSPCPVGEGVAVALIGSAADCPVRLLDPSVSGYHAALVRASGEVWVVDLLGRGGLTIHGAAARVAPLAEGDEVRLGESSLRLGAVGAPADEDEAEPPSPAVVPALVSAADLAPVLAGLPAEQAALAETLLVPLANQFARMQQQWLEQLHRAEADRFRALAAYQREEFGALREELDQLRELRQELDDLRGELKAPGPGRPAVAAGGASVARPRLGSAAPSAPREPAPALAPPEAPTVLRMTVGEAS